MKVSILSSPLLLMLSASEATAQYVLNAQYSGSSFLNNFNFFSAADPTRGFVNYLTQSEASAAGLIKTKPNGATYLGVDFKNTYPNTAEGRPSVRIESKASWTRGLFIADIAHMPARACGTWPAFWTLGAGTWPTNGEIDIIEGISKNDRNSMVLHTSTSCVVDSPAAQSGSQVSTNCSVPFGPQGCVTLGDTNGYGDVFNANGGGVYAMEWTLTGIKMWFFPRNAIPASITNGRPNIPSFGTPVATFAGSGCDWKNSFNSHRLIFDTTFCGDWAGNVYDTSVCPSTPGASPYQSCIDHVAAHPGAFKQVYWEINSVKVYKKNAASSRVRRSLSIEEFSQAVY